jgi:hypothetical protein
VTLRVLLGFGIGFAAVKVQLGSYKKKEKGNATPLEGKMHNSLIQGLRVATVATVSIALLPVAMDSNEILHYNGVGGCNICDERPGFEFAVLSL